MQQTPARADSIAFIDLSISNGFSRHARHVAEFLAARGVTVEFLDLGPGRTPTLSTTATLFARSLWRILSRRGFVILATQANYFQVFLALAAVLARRALIYDMQDLTPESFAHLYGQRFPRWVVFCGKRWLIFSEKLITLVSKAVLVVSPGMREILQHRLAAGEKIFLFPNHHSLAILPRIARPPEPTIIYAGGLQPRYRGIERQLAALEQLPGWRMIIAGEGDQAWLKALVRRHGIEDRVQLRGFVSPQTVKDLWLQSDILVIEGVAYGLPSKFFEAVSAGVVVVSPKAAKDVNAILGRSAVIFDGGAQELSAAVLSAWNNLSSLREEQRRSLERFDQTIRGELDRLGRYLTPWVGKEEQADR